MATFQYNQQYPGDASISPASSFGYESANSWSQPHASPVSTANYGDVIHSSRSFDSSTGEKKSSKQIRAEAIQRHRNKKADLKALGMSDDNVHETKDQIKQDNAKEARDNARAAHRQKKAQMKAMAMMTVQHGGGASQSSSLTAKQAAGLRYDAQQSQKAEAKRLVSEMKNDPNEYVAKKLVAARGMEKQATTSRKIMGKKWFGKTRDPDMQELKCQLEREREQDAEKKALKYLKVFETEEGFQIM
jgi:hypothetical protein